MCQTRYTDGKDQSGKQLPAASNGDFATDRKTGCLHQLRNGVWKLVEKAASQRKARRNPSSR